jgi:hypothetical protein
MTEKEYKRNWYLVHRDECLKRAAQRRKEKPEYQKEWFDKHPDYRKEWRKNHPGFVEKWYFEHPEEFEKRKVYVKNYNDNWYNKNRDVRLEKIRAASQEIKKSVLHHYGNEKYECVLCGENRIVCLSIDHINGGGL